MPQLKDETHDSTTHRNPSWYHAGGTARNTYSLEINSQIQESLFETYQKNGVETGEKEVAGLNFYDARKEDESVRVIQGDQTYLHYSRPKQANGQTAEELVEPLLDETETDAEDFRSMLER